MGSLRATGKSVNSIESLCPPLNSSLLRGHQMDNLPRRSRSQAKGCPFVIPKRSEGLSARHPGAKRRVVSSEQRCKEILRLWISMTTHHNLLK